MSFHSDNQQEYPYLYICKDKVQYVCKYCNSKFELNRNFQSHLKTIHQEKSAEESTNDSIQYNQKSVEELKLFECNYCNRKFKQDSHLQLHKRKIHQEHSVDDTTNECKICGKTFSKNKYLKAHNRNIHHNNFLHKCNICNQEFRSKLSLTRHNSKFHSEKNHLDYYSDYENTFECEICGKIFSQKRYLKDHNRNVHSDTGFHKCNICNKVFTHKNNIKRHIKNDHPHLDIKDQSQVQQQLHKSSILKSNEPDTCIITIKKDQSIYINTKVDNKVLIECHVCDEKFTNRFMLKEHLERFHYVEKCRICDKKFAKKCMLNTHLNKIHNMEISKAKKHIKCCVKGCCRSFSNLQNLRMHIMDSEDVGGHNYTIEEDENIFNNLQEFNQWKDDLEENDGLRYNTRRAARVNQDGSYTKTYNCSRSGTYCSRGTGHRTVKSQGTSKIGVYCPSAINVYCSSDGIVKCKYYKTHFGHETTDDKNMHIRIHKRDKLFIVEKRLQGVEIRKILEELHTKGGRSAYIKHQDIVNIFHSDLPKDLQKCRNSKTLNVYKISNDKYEVCSKDDEPHDITFLHYYCNCSNICLICGICDHSYSCDCKEYEKNNICEHIHAVGNVNMEHSEQQPVNKDCIEEHFQIPNENVILDNIFEHIHAVDNVNIEHSEHQLIDKVYIEENIQMLNENFISDMDEKEIKV